jgi:hypothetical protein
VTVAVAALVAWCTAAEATNLIVPSNYSTIQKAIDAASNGDVVIVIQGTYYENLNFKGKAITVRSGDPNQPALVATTIIDGSGKAPVVRFVNGEGAKAVISGFTLRNGLGVPIGGHVGGGGVLCSDTAPTISYNVITGNGASANDHAAGGGIMCVASSASVSPTIVGNTISNNQTNGLLPQGGGGIYTYACSPTIASNRVTGNQTLMLGGGIYCVGGNPTITHNVVATNLASAFGGMGGAGIALDATTGAVVSNCLIYGNTGGNLGGGILCSSGNAAITNCTIAGNTGPGVHVRNANVTLEGSIIASQVNPAGVGISSVVLPPVVRCCDVWGNAGGNYEGMTDLTGARRNIRADPLFSSVGDYRLQSAAGRWYRGAWVSDGRTSPCVDGGNAFASYANESAPNGGCVNMGWDGNTAQASRSPSTGPVYNVQQKRKYRSIQGAINAAGAGQTLNVPKGSYHERLDFLGKAITVRSETPTDPSVVAATVVNADEDGPVVSFIHGETSSALLNGFTLTGGVGMTGLPGVPWGESCGGGVCCFGSSPVISNSVITGNHVTLQGGGVYCGGGSPKLRDNVVSVNQADDGAGVFLSQCEAATVIGCRIHWNWGGDLGGGLSCGGGKATVTNCTIASNEGNGVRVADATVGLRNSIIAYQYGVTAGVGVVLVNGAPPNVAFCDLWGNTVAKYSGLPDQTGQHGNLSKRPQFVDGAAGNFRLQSTAGHWTGTAWVADKLNSPCLDAGDPTSSFSNEPSPNGGRLNMGFDGNTAYASRSPKAAAAGRAGLTVAVEPTARGAELVIMLAAPADVTVTVSNIAGRTVALLAPGRLGAGSHRLAWNGMGGTGTRLPGGTYLVRVAAHEADGASTATLTPIRLLW